MTAGDLLYLVTDAGKRFFVIASVDSTTQITLDIAPTSTTTTGLTWGVGGRRATLDDTNSRRLFESPEMTAGMKIQLEDDQVITSALFWNVEGNDGQGVAGYCGIQGDSESNHRQIATSQANGAVIDMNSNKEISAFLNLKFVCTNSTRSSSTGILSSNNYLHIENCIFGDATYDLGKGIDIELSITPQITFVRCAFVNCGQGVEGQFHNPAAAYLHDCYFKDCTVGLDFDTAYLYVDSCLFDSCATGIQQDGNGILAVTGSRFYNSTDHIICNGYKAVIRDNIFSVAAGHAIDDTSLGYLSCDYNVFHQSSGGHIVVGSHGANDIQSLAGSPYSDPTAGDFNINNLTGAGKTVRALTRQVPAG